MSAPTCAFVLRTTLMLREDAREHFAKWQSRVTDELGKFPGFLNSEFMRDSVVSSPTWRVTVRFSQEEHRRVWVDSDQWRALLDELKPLVCQDPEVDVFKESGGGGSLTEVIVTKVKPQKMQAYRDWEIRIRETQGRFPGFLGSFVHPPQPGEDTWTTLITFDSEKNLLRWMESPERKAMLEEVVELVEYNHAHSIHGSFPGWVPNNPATGMPPPNWKTAFLVLLGLYPIVSMTILFVNPFLTGLTSAVTAFIGCMIGVTLTTWATMPLLIRCFGWWLYPKSKNKADIKGAAIIALLFLLQILIFEAAFRFR